MKLPSIRAIRPAKAAAVLAVVAGAIFASVLPSSADVSAQSPSQSGIRVQSPAERLARGAAVRVETTVVCAPGSYAYVNVRLTQRVGPGIASGGASTQVSNCTGSLQSVFLSVHAEEHPFRAGTAFASAYLSGPYPGSVTDDREIAIVNP
ncbi:hypothetical protein [Saccharothrix deserti]|uniref:hypothetical protein n=1 Tax=Saccharothrix deserti TaxID=2593674 RepID=UPI00131D98BA|nr:hypothetical protein [Saccharothrix deserti]